MNNNKVLYLVGNFITYMGDALFTFIISWWLIKITGDTKLLGTVLGIAIFPAIILNLIMGNVIDRNDKKKLIVICDMASGIICIITYFLIDTQLFFYVLIATTFCLHLFNNIFSVASKAIIKSLFDKEEIIKITSYQQFLKQVTKIAGPLVGGGLILIISPKLFILINGCSFCISALMEIRFKYIKEPEKSKGKDDAFRFDYITLIKEQKLTDMVVFMMANNFFLTAVTLFIPYLVVSVFKVEAALGIVLAFEAAGSLCAVVLIKYISTKISYEMLALFASISLVLCSKNIILVCGGLFLFGMFVTLFNVKFMTELQLKTDDHLIGRVISIVISFAIILVPIGNFIFGMIGSILGGYCVVTIGIILSLINFGFILHKARIKKQTLFDSKM